MPGSHDSMPDFSGVEGGASSGAASDVSHRTYTVAKGDSLSAIARHLYGDAAKWKLIFEANKDQIKNPDLIYPGQVLEIPEG